jgi:hypothetical protein
MSDLIPKHERDEKYVIPRKDEEGVFGSLVHKEIANGMLTNLRKHADAMDTLLAKRDKRIAELERGETESQLLASERWKITHERANNAERLLAERDKDILDLETLLAIVKTHGESLSGVVDTFGGLIVRMEQVIRKFMPDDKQFAESHTEKLAHDVLAEFDAMMKGIERLDDKICTACGRVHGVDGWNPRHIPRYRSDG